jgi:hypothetical protein
MVARVEVEYVGGPQDGDRGAFTAKALREHGGLPRFVHIARNGVRNPDPAAPCYASTARLTASGRVAFEYRPRGRSGEMAAPGSEWSVRDLPE